MNEEAAARKCFYGSKSFCQLTFSSKDMPISYNSFAQYIFFYSFADFDTLDTSNSFVFPISRIVVFIEKDVLLCQK